MFTPQALTEIANSAFAPPIFHFILLLYEP